MLSLLASPLAKLGTIILLVAGLWLYRATLVHERNSARAALAQAEIDLGTCRANTATLMRTINDQDAAITTERNNEQLIVQAARQRETTAAAAASSVASATVAQVQMIERMKIDSGCDAAIKTALSHASALADWRP